MTGASHPASLPDSLLISHSLATASFSTSSDTIKDRKYHIDIDSLINKAVSQLADLKIAIRMAKVKLQQQKVEAAKQEHMHHMEIAQMERMEAYKVELAKITANSQDQGSMQGTGFASSIPQGRGVSNQSASHALWTEEPDLWNELPGSRLT
jgi:hypothetical protein